MGFWKELFSDLDKPAFYIEVTDPPKKEVHINFVNEIREPEIKCIKEERKQISAERRKAIEAKWRLLE